jgi:hypothetical protein
LFSSILFFCFKDWIFMCVVLFCCGNETYSFIQKKKDWIFMWILCFGLWVFLFSMGLLNRGSFRLWVLVFMRCNWKKEFSFHVSIVERSKHYLFCYKGLSIEAECSFLNAVKSKHIRRERQKKNKK